MGIKQDKGNSFLGDIVSEVRSRIIEERQYREDEIAYQAGDEASQRERYKMIHSAILAFIELNASNEVIYNLLDKYFGVDTIREAKELTRDARINSQVAKIKEYKRSQGLTVYELREYAHETDLYNRLENEEKLLTLPVDKLVSILEKGK